MISKTTQRGLARCWMTQNDPRLCFLEKNIGEKTSKETSENFTPLVGSRLSIISRTLKLNIN